MLDAVKKVITQSDNFVFLDTARQLADERCSYLFSQPVDIITGSGPEDVRPVHDKIRQALQAGMYVAGWWSYEWGYALIPKLNHLLQVHRPDYPLVWLGVYRKPLVREKPLTLENSCSSATSTESADFQPGPLGLDTTGREFINAVTRVQDYIRAGDTYQVNYTVRSRFSYTGSPFELYRRLRSEQAVSYGAVIKAFDRYVLSLSPELFFHRKDNRIWSKPMKGTAARGKTPEEDSKQARFLENDIKNRAENVMIVDLLRNDLGRIARTGSVTVPRLFHVEKYATLFQMISRIEAELRCGITWQEIFQALFPCGSITGAPKIRTMEIISELETSPRGIYTGSIGFIAPDNHAVLNVAIRTLVLDGSRGEMGIGSGITIGSDPEAEYEETRLKLKFLEQAMTPHI